jgi:phosphatidyl-myo-inositol dimannoside synthase
MNQRKLNILIFAKDFKPNFGGVAEYTHQIAEHLKKMGHNVFIITKYMENCYKFDSQCIYEIVRLDFKSLKLLKKATQFFKLIKIFKDYINKYKINIIINNFIYSESYISLLMAKLYKIPFVIFTYGTEINTKTNNKRNIIRRFLLNNSDKVFTISNFSKKLLISAGIPESKLLIVKPGINLDNIKLSYKGNNPIVKKFNLEGSFVILTIGRLIERKGHDMVIKAIPRILKEISNIVYLIVGDGNYRDNLTNLVKKLDINSRVILVGNIEEEEKYNYYNACDLFVMPCRELENGNIEGFGIVFCEASAYRKAVVAGNSGGVPDAVENKMTGILVNPLDVKEIADTIMFLLKNPQYRKKLGREGHNRVNRELNWAKIVKKMEENLFKSLIHH